MRGEGLGGFLIAISGRSVEPRRDYFYVGTVWPFGARWMAKGLLLGLN